MRSARLTTLSFLALGSGCCALVYQIGWVRELRLVFGASTHASAAVLAIFMGGLGLGAAVLGPRADRHPRPLRFYALLELGIAAGAALSPLLFVLIRKAYLATGGVAAMGQPAALGVRLALSALALAVPTFLMGGTLPAIVRRAETELDAARRRVALLYGVNTLGALAGAVVATFLLLERFGTRRTILAAAALNAAVGAAAFLLSRGTPAGGPVGPVLDGRLAGRREPASTDDAAAPRGLLAGAAFLSGFVFFLMELVWYRMLAPLLGGTIYSFGLVLAVALAGIGLGGLLFSLLGGRPRFPAAHLAATFGLEALALALSFGLGDRLALLALALRPSTVAGLAELAPGWALVCAIVAFPAALVAGYQFPLLVSMAGKGDRRVGGDTGAIYAWNTAGSIAGSLLGGFALLPLLGAVGCWRLAAGVLGAVSLALGVASLRAGAARGTLAASVGAVTATALLLAADGPTAAWRHSPIGAGMVELADRSPNGRRAWLNEMRSRIVWERDGIESGVGLDRADGLAFVVNGKVDGNARGDAGVQVVGPLIGAVLHPDPRSAMVIGLGTGSSAGWLAAIDSVERVDVAELEPEVLEVARRCAPVNRDVLSNPKVRIIPGDGREILLTSRERYDLVFSEPSNPYRAGIAALYTREFYQAVADRLAPGGIFTQWIQAYSVDPATVRLVAATLASVFGDVETWHSGPGDLVFVCSAGPKDYTLARLAARLESEPFRSGLLAGWGVTGVEGLLSGYLANDTYARHAARTAGTVNTDDRSPVEFGFARGIGQSGFAIGDFRRESRARGAHRPAIAGGAPDWERVETERLLSHVWQGEERDVRDRSVTAEVLAGFLLGRHDEVVRAWEGGGWAPVSPFEEVVLGESLAQLGDERAPALLPRVASLWPATGAAIEARFLLARGEHARSLEALARAAAGYRGDPWNPKAIMRRSLALGTELARAAPALVPQVFELFEPPWSVAILDRERIATLVDLATLAGPAFGARALASHEPNVPWDERTLRLRAGWYAKTGHPLAARARRELAQFESAGRAAR